MRWVLSSDPMSILAVALVVTGYAYSASLRLSSLIDMRAAATGAFGSLLFAVGPSGFQLASIQILFGLALGAELLGAIWRRQVSVRAVASHVVVLGVAGGTFTIATALMGAVFGGKLTSAQLLIPLFASSLVFAVRRGSSAPKSLVAFGPVLSMHAFAFSLAGLAVMTFPAFGPFVFAFVLTLLFVTEREFRRFEETEVTYEQTVRALGRLTERAGYVSAGHHERVAELAEQASVALRLPSAMVKRLKWVALLHDVGAVSFSDPETAKAIPHREIVQRTRAILNETEYLRPYEYMIDGLGGTDEGDLSIEARILRIANDVDELRSRQAGPMGSEHVGVVDGVEQSALGCVLDALKGSGPGGTVASHLG
ncbi:MAG TPA: HD domain-containing protein [Actinomycetota bacterium]|nr:HD domain-containing protein [Actinomycetota bacterium]